MDSKLKFQIWNVSFIKKKVKIYNGLILKPFCLLKFNQVLVKVKKLKTIEKFKSY